MKAEKTTTERRSVESELSMIIQSFTFDQNKEFSIKVLLNDDVEINVISYRYAVVCDMQLIESDLSTSQFLNESLVHCYDAFNVRTRLVNS